MRFEFAEPETTTTGDQSMTEKAETTAPTTIEAQVAAWSSTTADLVAAVKATEGITVSGHAEGPKKGRLAVHTALMALTGHRTSIEKRRTELKRPILDLGKLVDSEAARLTGIISPREAELRADRDAYDAEQERIQREAEAQRQAEEAKASEERRKALQARVDIVATLGGQIDLVGLQTATDEEFAAQVATLTAARDERERLAKIEREAREAAEAARLEKLRQETEAAAWKVQEAREAAERAEQERKDADERKESERLQAEADAKAEAERLAQEEADRIEEAARVAALAPDLDKLRAWSAMARESIPALPTITDPELRTKAEDVSCDLLHRIAMFVTEELG